MKRLALLVIGATAAGLLPAVAAAAGPPAASTTTAASPTAATPKMAGPPAAPGLLGTDRMIVRLRTDAVPDAVPDTAALGAEAGTTVHTLRHMDDGAFVVQLPGRLAPARARAVAARWTARSDVLWAEPDAVMQPTQVPDDPRYPTQWHYQAPVAGSYGANLPAAWDVTTGSPNAVVAVVDTGKLDHADLAGRFLPGYDMVSDSRIANDGNARDADPSDPGDWITGAESTSGFFTGCQVHNSSWHGTHVSGTIGAVSNNGLGVAGINWNARILPVRVLGKCGGYISDIADGIRWAAGLAVSGAPANPNPARVISLSLGGSGTCSSTYQDAITAAYDAGSLVAIAAGNSNVDASTQQPGSCNNIVTVAASGSTGSRASYSNYGTTVEITAPGGDSGVGPTVLSTLNAGTTTPGADSYASYQGTSMATPHVAGVASLIKSVAPLATPAQILGLIQANVTPFPAGSTCTVSICGPGLLNAGAAVAAAARLPDAPAAPSAIAAAGQAALTWTAPAANGGLPVTGYVVTPYVGAVAQAPVTFNDTSTGHTVTGLANGTTYTFTVAARNIVGTGAASGASNAVTPATVPGAPTIGTAVRGNAEATVTWTAPADDGGSPITGYTVTPFVGASAQSPVAFGSAATSQTVGGLTNGTTYTFKVAATTGAGTGPRSAASNAVTPATLPGAPTIGTAIWGDARVTVSWTAPAGNGGSAVTGYRVTAHVGGSALAPVTFGDTLTTHTVTGLTNGTTYTFTVAATNAVGTGAESAPSNPATPATVPGAPTIGTATAGDARATVTWTAPADDGGTPITGYAVTPFVGTTARTPVVFDDLLTSHTVPGLTNGTTYTFTVAAINAAGTGPASAASDAVALTPTSSFTSGPVPAVAGSAPSTGTGFIPAGGSFGNDSYGDVYWYGAARTDVVWNGSSAATFTAAATTQQAVSLEPLVGDFDGDGIDDIYWYGPGSAVEQLWLGGGGPGFTTQATRTVSGTYTPAVGDFNGDGTDDIYWYGPGSTADSLWTGHPDTTFTNATTTAQNGTFVPVPGDYDGDGRDDIYWYAPGAPAEVMFRATGTGTFTTPATRTVSGTYTPVGGDFNGDGRADIFWYAPGSGFESVWLGSVGGLVNGTARPVNGTYTPLSLDANGDGRDDIYWCAPGSTPDALYLGGT